MAKKFNVGNQRKRLQDKIISRERCAMLCTFVLRFGFHPLDINLWQCDVSPFTILHSSPLMARKAPTRLGPRGETNLLKPISFTTVLLYLLL